MAELKDDPTTYEILKAYLADEEEDLYWSQGQLEIFRTIRLKQSVRRVAFSPFFV